MTGQPSISLPIYRNADGLSTGVQLTTDMGTEDLLLLLAKQMEVIWAIFDDSRDWKSFKHRDNFSVQPTNSLPL
ncbi:hypothetical protein KFY46_26270 [Salmonella enterica subsp. enterica serovar 1,4,[5],12:i:-]|nr:hypothetical protein [Salmonella enterica subsp. enterica serovar 1,4,[5],12:i:-]